MTAKQWRGRWVADFTLDGQRIRRVSPIQTRRGAQAYELELRSASSASSASSTRPPRLDDFAIEWLTERVVVVNKPSDRVRKESILRLHLLPALGGRCLDEITPRDLDAYVADRRAAGLGASTVNGHLAVLSALLHCAAEWGRLDKAPRIRRLPTEPFEFDWLRPAEADRLLAVVAPEPKWSAMFTVALRTGLRRGELFALHWSAVDLERRAVDVHRSLYHGRLTTPKNHRRRTVPLTADAVTALERWRPFSPGELVFPGADGDLDRSQSRANEALHRALDAVDIRRVRVHDLRHSFASHLVLRGVPLRVIQRLLGHHSILQTERYAHVADESLTAAVALLEPKAAQQSGHHD